VFSFLAYGSQTIMVPVGGLICLGLAAVLIVVIPLAVAVRVIVGLRRRRASRKEQ
jgi:hypothetical protein